MERSGIRDDRSHETPPSALLHLGYQQFSLWPEVLWLRHCDVIVPTENLTQRRNVKRPFVAPLRRCVKPVVAVLVLRCENFQEFMAI